VTATAWSASATARQGGARRDAKGVEAAKKHFFRVPRIGGTIPHPVQGEESAGVVLLKPPAPGPGSSPAGPVRAVLECAGISDVLSRSLGSSNPINVVHATVAALKSLNRPRGDRGPAGAADRGRGARGDAARPRGGSRGRNGQQLTGSASMAQLKVTETKSRIGGTPSSGPRCARSG